MHLPQIRDSDHRPNILVIMSDEHDPAVTGCYGHPHVQTPHLDRLAADGVVFDRAYCNSPMCVPSRASFLTGQYVHQIGVWDNGTELRAEIPTFANYFEAAGYDTILCGRMHMIGDNRLHGFGHRLYDDMDGWKFSDQRPDRTPEWRRGSASHVTESGAGSGSWQQYDETATSLAERFLVSQGERPSPTPWLLVCGLMFPHFPLRAPEHLFNLYWPANVDIPDTVGEPLATQHAVIQHLRYAFRNDEALPDEVIRRALASYYALVTLTDANVGRLVDAIDTSALRDNTIIIYTSDHGEMAGHHGIWQKQCFYEPSVRIPLHVRIPGGPASIRIPDNVSLVDVMPTLLEMAEIPIPPHLAGDSLCSRISGSGAPERPVFSEYHAQGMLDGGYMLKHGDWKYIYYAGGYPPQLFHSRSDPDETQDLGEDPRHQQTRSQLHKELLAICDPDAVNGMARADQQTARMVGRAG